MRTRPLALLLVLASSLLVSSLLTSPGLASQAEPCGPPPSLIASPTQGHGAAFDRPPTLRDLGGQAQVALEARVLDWRSYRVGAAIQTDLRLQVERVVAGENPTREATLTVRGGEVNGVHQAYAETPAFARSQLMLLLARRSADGSLRLIDDFLGALPITPDCRVPAAGLPLEELRARTVRAIAGRLEDRDDVTIAHDVSPRFVLTGTGPWPLTRQPVAYTWNPGYLKPDNLTEAEVRDAWIFGYGVWDLSSANLTINPGGETNRTQPAWDGSNDIMWSDQYTTDSRILATTAFGWDQEGLQEVDITFNRKKMFTTTGSDGVDLATVALHEAGHGIGLGHSLDSDAIMYVQYHGVLHDLTPDDLAGLDSLYGGLAVPLATATATPTSTELVPPSATPLPTFTRTATPTRTSSPSATPSSTATTQATPTATPSWTATTSATLTVTRTAIETQVPVATTALAATATSLPAGILTPTRTAGVPTLSATGVPLTPSPTSGTTGGHNLSLRAGSAALRWDGGTSQQGYFVLRWAGNTLELLPSPTAPLASTVTNYSDPTAPTTVPACYALLVMGSTGPLGISDLLCFVPGVASGASRPTGFTVELAESTHAALRWDAPGGQTSYSLWSWPTNGASPPVEHRLGPTATSASHDTGGASTCYLLVALAGSTPLGNTDVLCAVPGIASLR